MKKLPLYRIWNNLIIFLASMRVDGESLSESEYKKELANAIRKQIKIERIKAIFGVPLSGLGTWYFWIYSEPLINYQQSVEYLSNDLLSGIILIPALLIMITLPLALLGYSAFAISWFGKRINVFV